MFLFTSVNLTAQLLATAQPQFHPSRWTDPFDQVVPYLRDALRKVLAVQACFSNGCGSEVAKLIRELCDPEPTKRGSPKIGPIPPRYSMQRYVSILERLIAEVKVKGIAA